MNQGKKYAAEFIGTFGLVFAGTGAIVINDVSGGAVTSVGIGLTFGLIVLAMIYAIGDVSGAHLNPAVTLGFFVGRRLEATMVLQYILSQLSGALAASLLLRALFPQHLTLGLTAPTGLALQSLILEIILTALLMFVILNVSEGAKERGITAGIAVGTVIAREALFAGPISGASMNPARSFAPSVSLSTLRKSLDISGRTDHGRFACGSRMSMRAKRLLFRWPSPQYRSNMKQRVLFICVHNSARSQMAEAFLSEICGDQFEAHSAGLEQGGLNPLAVEAMREIGIDISRKQTQSVFDVFKSGELFAYVITVCDETSAERCPFFPGRTIRLHWGFPDPSALQGSRDEKLVRIRKIRDTIKAKVEAWCGKVCPAAAV